MLAAPVPETKKKSKDKKKAPTALSVRRRTLGLHGKVFDRLGLELLHVTDDGKAIVHAEHERLKQLLQRTSSLKDLGPREQARWANIDSFETIPLQLRVDGEWLQSLHREEASDVVFELQPVLTRRSRSRVAGHFRYPHTAEGRATDRVRHRFFRTALVPGQSY